MAERLAGKVAVVTGGGSGIGQASAVLFAREGAKVAVVDRDASGVGSTVALIHEAGGVAIGCVSDVGQEGAATADARRVAALWGSIDVLLTAAGVSTGGTVLTTDPAAWDDVFRINVGGTWLWARAVLPGMRARGGGSIVTVASQLALAGGRGNSAYIASKGAILSLTRTMALDFADDGVRVNAVLPGAIDTPLLARSFARRDDPDAAREASRARHPLGRFGAAGEVAEAALYLASDAAGFTTGVSLPVDGGWLVG
ncbi:MAG TPA: SDR family oxidoreductase [Stellaceae bacterium]|nr:SDR family oxidoreductase [Stellaceae bacterium]